MGYLISTLIDARKLCSLVISMLMSILQDVGTYMGRAYENPTPLSARKSCINRQFMKIQSRLFQVHNRKRRES